MKKTEIKLIYSFLFITFFWIWITSILEYDMPFEVNLSAAIFVAINIGLVFGDWSARRD